MRIVSLHPDAILLSSQVWQTNCTIVHAGEECFMIDSPILPEELHALPAVLEQTGLSLSGLLSTHGDWDHLLGRLAFPDAPLGCAQSTSERLHAAPGEPQRELRAFDERHYLDRGALALAALQALPVPGRLGVGPHELELHPAEGHTADGMAIWAPWAKVLVAGDYLSSVEIPFLGEGGGTLDAYRATLERLRPLTRTAEHVVPGHGPVLDGAAPWLCWRRILPTSTRWRRRARRRALPAGRREARCSESCTP